MNDGNSIIIKSSLEEIFSNNWEQYRIFLFSAPCGYGKTTTAKALLSKHNVCELDVLKGGFLEENIPKECTVVLVDDLQYLLKPDRQNQLRELIIARSDLHFVLLGRGNIPGWLMPFQFSGILFTIKASMLQFDRSTVKQMVEAINIMVSDAELDEINRVINGYPVGMNILCRKLKEAQSYSKKILDEGKCELFFYFEQAVYMRLEESIRHLIIRLAPFDNFNIGLAKLVSGNTHVGELIGVVQRDSTMLSFDGIETYSFQPFFQQFLLWQMQKKLTDPEQKMVYSRAALYYELQDNLDKSLKYYSLADEKNKVSELLIEKADQHPGIGYYYQLQKHYFSLSREEILKSSSLISGMSMITALCMDYEASEEWYKELENYSIKFKKDDLEYKDVQGKLAYLDIALPQRGIKSFVNIITSIFKLLKENQLTIPAFSVTSTLPSIMNGGKDFCGWSKKDDLLYTTMKKPLQAILGRDSVGLAECAIYESKFEKGEDISKRLLTLMSRLDEIQVRGTLDIEFAVVGLLVRVQLSQGKPLAALEFLESFRIKIVELNETRFLGNIEAMMCRIHMRLGDTEYMQRWLREKAPKNDVRLWMLWRYQYMTRGMVKMAEGKYEDALLLLTDYIRGIFEVNYVSNI